MEARQVRVGWLKDSTGQTEGVMIGEWNCMPVWNFEMEARQVGWLKDSTGQTEGVMIGEWNCMPVRNFEMEARQVGRVAEGTYRPNRGGHDWGVELHASQEL